MVTTENIQLSQGRDRRVCAHCFQEPVPPELQILHHQLLESQKEKTVKIKK